jgi:hypothetical protein
MLSGMPVPELYRKHTEYAVGVKNSELGSNSTSTADPRKERFKLLFVEESACHSCRRLEKSGRVKATCEGRKITYKWFGEWPWINTRH